MLKSILVGSGVIKENDRYILYKPKNSQDMNYHLVDKETRQEHLIDICDVYDEPCDDYEYYGGIIYDELVDLSNIEDIMLVVWKTIDQEIELEYFEAWSGGLLVLNAIKEHDRSLEIFEALESILSADEETANTATQVNDFLWFDAEDIIQEHFGIDLF